MLCCPRSTRNIVAALFAVLAVGNVHAIPIGPVVGDFYNFTWSTTGGGYHLSGEGIIEVEDFTSSSVTLGVSLTNTSTTAGGTFLGADARLTAWGFGINPNVTGVAFVDGNDGGMVGASLGSIPSLKIIEVCVFGGQNCAGGANGGIPAHDPLNDPNSIGTDVFQLVLAGTFFTPEGSPLSLNIQPLGYKYQTNIGSFEFSCDTPTSGTPNCTTPPPPTQPVPEPGSLALLGAALMAGFGLARRRKP